MSRKNTTCLLPKNGQQLRCHCGCLAVLRPAEEVCKPPFPGAMAYVCSNYPKCDSFVIADPVTKQPRATCVVFATSPITSLTGCINPDG